MLKISQQLGSKLKWLALSPLDSTQTILCLLDFSEIVIRMFLISSDLLNAPILTTGWERIQRVGTHLIAVMCCLSFCATTFLQDGGSLLIPAAASGNISLFEWLVDRYKLIPNKWSEVSYVLLISPMYLCVECDFHGVSSK